MQENIYRFFEKYNEFNKGRKTLEKHDQYKQIMADAVFTYDKVFSDKHTLNAMIGMNYTQDDTYKLKGTGSEALRIMYLRWRLPSPIYSVPLPLWIKKYW